MKPYVIGGLLGLALALSAPDAAPAGTPYKAKAVCPVDGATFEYTGTASYSTFGSFLDGMPEASWTMPLPIPQCPESRFPVYRNDFSDADKVRIRALVATPEYEAIRGEAPYYVLWYVFDRLEPPREGLDIAWPLLEATWQVHDDPERYARYVALVIPLMETVLSELKTKEPDNWWYFQIVLANLARQSGDFSAAAARLDALEGAPPAVGDLALRLSLTRELIAQRDRSVKAPPRT